MIDLDNGPLVFMLWIAVTVTFPALYGIFFVDAHWRKHQQDDDTDSDDAFN